MATQGAIDSPNPHAAPARRGRTHPPILVSPSPEIDRAADRWRLTRLVVVATSLIAIAWLALVFLFDPVRFVVLNPRAKTGFEIFLALAQIFGAFVLVLSPIGPAPQRMHRIAAAFLVLGAGALSLGYLYPLLVDDAVLSATMYGSLYVRTIAMLLIAAGLCGPTGPVLRQRTRLLMLIVVVAAGVAVVAMAEALPPLLTVGGMTTVVEHSSAVDAATIPTHAHLADIEAVVGDARTVFPGLTVWHIGLSLFPLAFGVLAVVGAARRHASREIGTWLLVAVVLLTGSQLHSLFWPSMYSSILTTTSVLRLAVAAVIIIGGVLELRAVVEERARLIAREQDRVRRLEDLAALKADFTSIVAHELASPLAAIATMSAMVGTGALSEERRRQVAESIGAEARALQVLVEDVRASADVERADFQVESQRVPVAALLLRAESYGRTLPGGHPLTIEQEAVVEVLADPERIGQVLRNLLDNATTHTPPGTPITLRARAAGDLIVFEVADTGPGIDEHDRARIFEKFGRGGDTRTRDIPGRGLGLYLSRRILRTHGTELTLQSEPGRGATFSFTLDRAT